MACPVLMFSETANGAGDVGDNSRQYGLHSIMDTVVHHCKAYVMNSPGAHGPGLAGLVSIYAPSPIRVHSASRSSSIAKLKVSLKTHKARGAKWVG